MFLLLGAGFFLVACNTTRKIEGHWSVTELNAGYLEFTIQNDSMVVCSPKYGLLYEGRVEVKSGELIQHSNKQFPNGGNRGIILEQTDSTLVLVYDDTIIENCSLISRDIPIIEGMCFPGSHARRRD